MRIWNYRCYVDHRGKNPVGEWLSGLSKKAQANLKRSLEILSCLEMTDWHKPNPASLTENHIYVIRFKDENGTQRRIYGHHDTQRKVFVLSTYGIEKGNKYDPPVKQCVSVCTIRMEQCNTEWDARTCACLSANGFTHDITSDFIQNRLAGR
jgi:hypothetical protein